MNPRLEADVVIVGAGPAGAATAALMAREGFDVLLVDRHAFPRPKPCGDCLSPEASRVLDRLGVLDDIDAAAPARLEGWRVVGPGGATFEARFADIADHDAAIATSLAIERARLDAVLLRHAIRAGARFLAPVHVNRLGGGENGAGRLEARISMRAHGTRAGAGTLGASVSGPGTDTAAIAAMATIRAPLIIGADGLRSVIAASIGARHRAPRRRKLSFTAHGVGVRGVTTIGELHVGNGACVGIAPVAAAANASAHAGRRVHSPERAPPCLTRHTERGGLMSNVTLVVESDRFGRAAAADPVAFFAVMLERFPAVRGRLRGTRWAEHAVSSSMKPLLASASFDRPVRRVIADGVALVGDAAGYFDPFTGQGIYHALAGAEMLAEAARRALAGGTTGRTELRKYARQYTRLIGPVHRVQRLIDEVLRRPVLAEAAIARLGRRPAAARALLAVTSDLRPPASLLSPAVLLSLATPI